MKRTRMLRKRRSMSRIARVGLAALVLTVPYGTAYAYWSTPGSGSATATAGTLNSVTIDSVFFDGTLRPGTSIPVHITVTNSNSFSVTVFSLTAGAITSNPAGCSGVTLVGLAGVTGTVFPNGQTTLDVTASMPTTAPSVCQGATFSTQLDLTVRK